ncbi:MULTISPECIES: hypothetical protein [Sphaerospermopsis]|jgi:hypothetical protein|nr:MULTISPECIES: hypothetical protein [Sphaerospermopsis]MBD2147626.1 hypothetical protein [Sphaerospermopsis sp. FACHB-1194]
MRIVISLAQKGLNVTKFEVYFFGTIQQGGRRQEAGGRILDDIEFIPI